MRKRWRGGDVDREQCLLTRFADPGNHFQPRRAAGRRDRLSVIMRREDLETQSGAGPHDASIATRKAAPTSSRREAIRHRPKIKTPTYDVSGRRRPGRRCWCAPRAGLSASVLAPTRFDRCLRLVAWARSTRARFSARSRPGDQSHLTDVAGHRKILNFRPARQTGSAGDATVTRELYSTVRASRSPCVGRP